MNIAPRNQPTYKTLLVYQESLPAAEKLMQCFRSLGASFGARLLGVATPAFIQTCGFKSVSESSSQDRLENDFRPDLVLAAAQLRECAGMVEARSTWKSRRSAAFDAFEREAHAADLLVVPQSYVRALLRGVAQSLKPVLRLGRPVLIVPPQTDRIEVDRAVVCWNHSPQCRRAMFDAMPFLARAREVIVLACCPASSSLRTEALLREIVDGLAARGINACPRVEHQKGARISRLIAEFALRAEADIVVAGAYGHGDWTHLLSASTTDDLIYLANQPVLLSR